MNKLVTLAGLALFAGQAFAGVSQLTSRAQITESDYIDWADMGPALTFLPSSTLATTHGTPFNVHVAGNGSKLMRVDQGFGWNGNFNPGEALLWTLDGTGLSLTGAKTCSDVGMNIQGNTGEGFTAYIAAYDGLDTLLGSFSVHGDPNFQIPGTAPFLGIHSDDGDIHRVDMWVVSDFDYRATFAIDRVSYSCCLPVPEPASMTALGIGALALLRKKAKKA